MKSSFLFWRSWWVDYVIYPRELEEALEKGKVATFPDQLLVYCSNEKRAIDVLCLAIIGVIAERREIPSGTLEKIAGDFRRAHEMRDSENKAICAISYFIASLDEVKCETYELDDGRLHVLVVGRKDNELFRDSERLRKTVEQLIGERSLG